MFRKPLFICFAILLMMSFIVAQNTKRRAPDPSKQNLDSPDDKLKKISLRLEVKGGLTENDSTFKIEKDKEVIVQVLASVSDQRLIGLGYARKPTRFKLILLGNDNNALSYPVATQERIRQEWAEIERRKSPDVMFRSSGPSLFIVPSKETVIGLLDLKDWYGKLNPGVYRIRVLFGFGNSENENTIQSETITLKII